MLDQVVEIEDSLGVDPGLSKTIEGIIFKTMIGDMEDKTAEGNIGMIGVMGTIEIRMDWGRDHSQEVIVIIELDMQAVVDLDQDPEPVLIETE